MSAKDVADPHHAVARHRRGGHDLDRDVAGELARLAQMTDNQKLYIVTMQSGPDLFRELVFGADMDAAREVAELRFDCRCVNIRRAACHPGPAVLHAALDAHFATKP